MSLSPHTYINTINSNIWFKCFSKIYGGSGASLVTQGKSFHLTKQEMWVWSLGWEDLEKEGFAWEIPWTEEAGGLQSKGLQKSVYDLVTKQKQRTRARIYWICVLCWTVGYGSFVLFHSALTNMLKLKLRLPSGREPACQCRRHKRCGFDPWVRKIPRRRAWLPHSSILVWRIPWTEKPGGLQSIGLQRVRHDWNDLARSMLKAQVFRNLQCLKSLTWSKAKLKFKSRSCLTHSWESPRLQGYLSSPS